MSDLIYSAWHRTLGYSYFAMDVDFIEIRNGQPVAVIEASMCTSWFPTCNGRNGVFNRFLRETGGFQLEMAWWVAKWFNVPAYAVCINDPDNLVHILSLINGNQVAVSTEEYLSFINEMSKNTNDIEKALIREPLELYNLLDLLSGQFPGVGRYPYFSNKSVWMRDYKQRLDEVTNKIPRIPPKTLTIPPSYPIKGETTGERPEDYQNLRKKSQCDYFNIQWMEWRKDNPSQKIGRPAAILKTIPIDTSYYSDDKANETYGSFKQSREFKWWLVCASQLLVPFYFVVFEVNTSKKTMGSKFWVSEVVNKQEYKLDQFDAQGYAGFISGL